MLKCLKRHGTDISSGTTATDAIVINFNIFEYSLTHLFTGGEALTVDGFDLQVVKETFCAGIIIAVALVAHAADNAMFFHKILIHVRAVLAAAI